LIRIFPIGIKKTLQLWLSPETTPFPTETKRNGFPKDILLSQLIMALFKLKSNQSCSS
jgi:hypothetical protein